MGRLMQVEALQSRVYSPAPLWVPILHLDSGEGKRHCQPQASAHLECALRGSRAHPKLLMPHFMSRLRRQIFAAWALCSDSRQEALLGPLLYGCDWSLIGPEESPSGNPQICVSCLSKA